MHGKHDKSRPNFEPTRPLDASPAVSHDRANIYATFDKSLPYPVPYDGRTESLFCISALCEELAVNIS